MELRELTSPLMPQLSAPAVRLVPWMLSLSLSELGCGFRCLWFLFVFNSSGAQESEHHKTYTHFLSRIPGNHVRITVGSSNWLLCWGFFKTTLPIGSPCCYQTPGWFLLSCAVCPPMKTLPLILPRLSTYPHIKTFMAGHCGSYL